VTWILAEKTEDGGSFHGQDVAARRPPPARVSDLRCKEIQLVGVFSLMPNFSFVCFPCLAVVWKFFEAEITLRVELCTGILDTAP
jgi:hypothetical protein